MQESISRRFAEKIRKIIDDHIVATSGISYAKVTIAIEDIKV